MGEVDGADVVVNLAGRSVDCRYHARNRSAIVRSRVDSTRAVAAAIASAARPPRVWLQASTATIYAHRYDAPNDEANGILGGDEPGAPRSWRCSIEVARAWEAAAAERELPGTRRLRRERSGRRRFGYRDPVPRPRLRTACRTALLLALGAAPAAAQEAVRDDAAGWWSWRPLRRPAVPDVGDDPFVQNDIDRFVLARLRADGLEPSPPADRAALIRRLCYDLTGLPPEPAEVEAFAADRRPLAFERLVDRLLASPQYGVKWGRHWLDLVRYAETNSFERDSRKPEVWRYRDWVVDAFNADLPWARFLTLQLAGDELPEGERDVAALVATGYHRLGLWDDEPTDPLQAIYDDLDSIADTTARSMLGISLGCARCHDHKKDPISQRDYWSFVAFFEHLRPYRPERAGNALSPRNYLVTVPVDGARESFERERAEFAAARRERAAQARTAAVAAYGGLCAVRRVELLAAADRGLVARYRGEHTEPTLLRDDAGGRHGAIEGQIVPVGGAGARGGTALRFDGDDRAVLPLLVSESFTIEFFVRSTERGRGRDEDPRWFLGSGLVDGEVPGVVRDFGIAWLGDGRIAAGTGAPETFVASPAGHADGAWHHVAFTRDRATGRIALYVDGMLCGQATGSTERLDAPPRLVVGGLQPGGHGFRGDLDELCFHDRALDAAEVVALALDVPGGLAAAAALREPLAGGAAADVLARHAALEPPRLPTVQVLCARERRGAPAPSFVRVRGNVHARGERVEPAFPAVFGAPPPAIEPPEDGRSSGRRTALARWTTAPDNPLTWRVVANRLWQHHFGRGLCRTPNDFGRLGELPTHPELLDWLACETIARGGRLKEMHRLILCSSTWRQACSHDPARRARDPQNDWFWRFDRRRLCAEEVRDSMLWASGELNPELGGPSVFPPLPAAVLATSSRPDEAWGRSPPDQAARRSIYVHQKRSLVDPLLAAFDAADSDASCPVRFATVQPTQALTLLNGDFAQEQARTFAARLQREAPDLEGQLARGLLLVTGRPPAAAEVDRLVALCGGLSREHGRSADEALQRCCLLLLNCNEFLYLD